MKYHMQHAHTHASQSKHMNHPYISTQSEMHLGRTSGLLPPYGCSGSGTMRRFRGQPRPRPFAFQDTQEYGNELAAW